MNLCAGTHEEVKWGPPDLPPRCRYCKQFVNYNVVEDLKENVDVARRHYPDGTTPKTRLGIPNEVIGLK